MKICLTFHENNYIANLSNSIDISVPLKNEATLVGTDTVRQTSINPNCFNAPPPLFTPLKEGNFIGDTREGGSVNFYNIQVNPHGNGTHTECVGHIAKERFYINDCLKNFHSIGVLITIEPLQQNDDLVITKELLQNKLEAIPANVKTLIIRTLPNEDQKRTQQYSGTNPAYFSEEAMQFIVDLEVEHLIVDLPSVDKEIDGGKLGTHHIFWNYPHSPRINATITEMVFIPDMIVDGLYLVNHQIMSIELDASPSKIVLFTIN